MKPEDLMDAMNDIKDEYIEEAKEERKGYSLHSFIKPICALTACVCLLFVFIPRNHLAMGGSYKTTDYYEESMAAETYDAQAPVEKNKVIVYSSLSMETKDLDGVIDDIENTVESFEGYISYSSLSTYDTSRTYYVTVRVPSNQMDAFIQTMKTKGNVTYYSKSQDDVTDSYTDSTSRLESLKKEEKRILELYEQAENIEELITVEARLTEIQEEITYLESTLNNLDKSIDYSTISIDVTETTIYSSNGDFISRIGYAFSNGWQNFVFMCTSILETIAYNWVLVVVILVVGFIWYKKKKK